MLKRSNDVWVTERDADLSFHGAVQAGKAGLKPRRLDLVKHLQANHACQVAVARAPDLRHAPLPRPAQEFEALGDVNARKLALALASEQSFQ